MAVRKGLKKVKPPTERQQWFIDRIGKKVYRPMGTCTCDQCEHAYVNGMELGSLTHASYCFAMEEAGKIARYFDNREEMLNFELNLKTKI